MKELYEIQDNACEALKRLKNKGNMSPADWEQAYYATGTIKNIDKIMMLRQGGGHSQNGMSHNGMSQAGHWQAEGMYGPGNSYNDGYSQKHLVRAHFSNAPYPMGGHSQHSGNIKSELEELLRSSNDKEREVLMRAISELKSF